MDGWASECDKDSFTRQEVGWTRQIQSVNERCRYLEFRSFPWFFSIIFIIIIIIIIIIFWWEVAAAEEFEARSRPSSKGKIKSGDMVANVTRIFGLGGCDHLQNVV